LNCYQTCSVFQLFIVLIACRFRYVVVCVRSAELKLLVHSTMGSALPKTNALLA